MNNKLIFILLGLDLLCGVAMLVGIGELISERGKSITWMSRT